MYYEKKVGYLDYCVGGEKKRGAGFVKAQVRGNDCRMSIHIRDIHTAEPIEAEMLLWGDGKEAKLRRIRIANGVGESGELRLRADQIGGGMRYEDVEKIIIPLSEHCEIVCLWRDKEKEKEKEKGEREAEEKAAKKEKVKETEEKQQAENEDKPQMEQQAKEGAEIDPVREADSNGVNEKSSRWQDDTELWDAEAQSEERAGAGEGRAAGVDDTASGREPGSWDGKIPNVTDEEAPQEEREKERASGAVRNRVDGYDRWEKAPFEDKWRQLSSIYPHMDITGEVTDCIAIKPADFVIFPTRYYSLVTNSFLLHGYHNYGHLVLARTEKRGEIKYYVGVPGIFFDKERQVALMFGFESFECGKDFAQMGDFGYYMIHVEL